MRLIDADKVNFNLYTIDEDENGVFRGFKSVSIVANEPTIDAVPVIRCKDCKHREYGYCNLHLSFYYTTADMDYCSRAERKEE